MCCIMRDRRAFSMPAMLSRRCTKAPAREAMGRPRRGSTGLSSVLDGLPGWPVALRRYRSIEGRENGNRRPADAGYGSGPDAAVLRLPDWSLRP